MKEELKSHIKKLQRRAALSLVAIILTIISIGFGILLLYVQPFAAISFCGIAIGCIVYLILSNRNAKKEAKESIYKPVVFDADKNLTFEEIIGIFKELSTEDAQLSTSKDVQFFRLNKIFKLRTVIYRADYFDKKEFDNAKDLINKKANKELNISQWSNRMESGGMMRFNIICTDALNDKLYQFISKNANRNLTRVEGIINIAVVGKQIMIPPLYGECDLAEICRYKNVIKFIHQILLNNIY